MDGFQPEKRKCKRHQLPVDVDAVIGNKLIQSRTRDISCAGMFITTPLPVEAGKDACVVFSLPNSHMPIKLKGKSVRTEPDGVAVRFHGISPYFVEILKEELQLTAVSLHSGDLVFYI